MIGRIVTMARTMLIGGRVPLRYWPKAVNYAVYLHNRIPSMARVHKVRHERDAGDKFSQRTFGPPDNEKVVFLGIQEGQKGYLCYVDGRSKPLVRKSVRFDEGKSWSSHGLKPGKHEVRFGVPNPQEDNSDSEDVEESKMQPR